MFSSFATDLISSNGEVAQVLVGDGVCIDLFGGLVSIDGLKINKQVSLLGLGGLSKTVVHDVQVLGGTAEYMILEADTSIYNPSNVALVSVGDVYCSIFYASASFGTNAFVGNQPHATVIIHDLTLLPGENRFKTRVNFQIASQEGLERVSALEMLSNFICCKPTEPIFLKGHSRKATKIPYLFESLKSLSILSSMPGLPSSMQMIRSALLLLHSPILSIASLSVPSKMQLLNSFAVTVTVTRMYGNITHDGNIICSIQQDLAKNPIVLPPNSVTWTREIWLKLAIGVNPLKALFDFDTRSGILQVDVDCSLDVVVGDYVIQGIKYTQSGLDTRIGLK